MSRPYTTTSCLIARPLAIHQALLETEEKNREDTDLSVHRLRLGLLPERSDHAILNRAGGPREEGGTRATARGDPVAVHARQPPDQD